MCAMPGPSIRRREVLTLIAAGALAPALAPVAAAQERPRRVGILSGVPLDDPESVSRISALRRRLGQLGWIEGRNYSLDVRSTGSDPTSRPDLAKALIASGADVIIAASSADVSALVQVSRTVPIVFATAADPIGAGLVQSLARPGGNVTGFANVLPSISPKWLELLKEMQPGVRRVGVLYNERTAPAGGASFLAALRAAAPTIPIEVIPRPVGDPKDFDAAISGLGRDGGLVLPPDSFTVVHRRAIVGLAAAHKVPAIYPLHYFPAAGGLMSYGPDLESPAIQTADYIDLILKGASPAELPVQSPRKFMLWINARAAAALGLSVPPVLLARADKVIE